MANNKVKLNRWLQGKTQDELGKETGIHQTRLCRIEGGFIQPNERERKALVEALEMPEWILFG